MKTVQKIPKTVQKIPKPHLSEKNNWLLIRIGIFFTYNLVIFSSICNEITVIKNNFNADMDFFCG